MLTGQSVSQGEGKIPEPPAGDVEPGVLPRLIATLVNRRRQVKSLMKDKTASKQKLLQVRFYELLRFPRGLTPIFGRVVGHQANGAQTHRQQYVWMLGF
jgi:hypothetical protein